LFQRVRYKSGASEKVSLDKIDSQSSLRLVRVLAPLSDAVHGAACPELLALFAVAFIGEDDVARRLGWQSFIKFNIFGSFLELAAQRGWTKGFFIEKPTLKSGTEPNRGT
jgi:hypothetical protein